MNEKGEAPSFGARYRFGDCELVLGRRLGEGPLEASVWKAVWTNEDGVDISAVARLYDLDSDEGDDYGQRLDDEAEALRRIDESEVACPLTTPRLIHKGRYRGGAWAVLVVGFVAGEQAGTVVPGSPMGAMDRVRLTSDLAATIGFLHTLNLVHGDVHSGNVLVVTTSEGRYRSGGLVDFAAGTIDGRRTGKAHVGNSESSEAERDRPGRSNHATDAMAVARFGVTMLSAAPFEDLDPTDATTWAIDGTRPFPVAELWLLLHRMGTSPETWYPGVSDLCALLGRELTSLQPLLQAASEAGGEERVAEIRFARAERAIADKDPQALGDALDAMEWSGTWACTAQMARAAVLAAGSSLPNGHEWNDWAVRSVARLVLAMAASGPALFDRLPGLARHGIATYLAGHRHQVEEVVEGRRRPRQDVGPALERILAEVGPVDSLRRPSATVPSVPGRARIVALGAVLAALLVALVVAALALT